MTTLSTDRSRSGPRVRRLDSALAIWREMPLWQRGLWSVFVASAALGTWGVIWRLVDGHLAAGYGSYVPWGLWIAIYFHGVGIAAGVFAASALGFLLQLPGFRTPYALRLAAVLVAATVLPALLAVGLDLGRMERAWRILFTPSFTSMMAFNAWTYLVLLGICAAVWWLSYRPDNGWLRPVLVLGLLISVMVPSQSGAFFGVVDAKPYWHSGLLPILMLISALTAGAATLLLVRSILAAGSRTLPVARADYAAGSALLRKVVLVGVGVYFLLEFAEFSVALWSPGSDAPALSLVLTGPYWWVFWGVHVLLGGLVPIALLLTRRPWAWVAAAALVAFSFLSTRLNILVPGQAVAELEGLQQAYAHPRLDYVYHATLMEYLVALFVLALGAAILYVGLRVGTAFETRTSRKDRTDAPQ